MEPTYRIDMDALPPVLRERLETAEMLFHDVALRVAEGAASLAALDRARECLEQQAAAVVLYVRDHEGPLLGFPERATPVHPAGH